MKFELWRKRSWMKMTAFLMFLVIVITNTAPIYAEGNVTGAQDEKTVEVTSDTEQVQVESVDSEPAESPDEEDTPVENPTETTTPEETPGASAESEDEEGAEEKQPEVTGSVVPTETPTMEGAVTETPTVSPTEVGTATPTGEVAATPEEAVTATPTATPSATPTATPSATPTATPEEEVQVSLSGDDSGISGEGLDKITISFDTEGLNAEDSFDFALSTNADGVTIQGNAFGIKEDGRYVVEGIGNGAIDITFNCLEKEAFSLVAFGEDISVAYSVSDEVAETEDGAFARASVKVVSDIAEETEETDKEAEENEEQPIVLSNQKLVAHTNDDAWVYVSGMLPEGATVTAEPVSVEIEGEIVLAAYDIKILDAAGKEYKITEAVTVSITAEALKETEAEEVSVYHMEDESARAEKVAEVAVNYNKVSFEAEGFSIYILTEEEALGGSQGNAKRYDISDSISASLRQDEDGDDKYARNDTLIFDFTYDIAADKLDVAKQNLTWYYSLESVLGGENAIFKNIVDGGSGYIFDAENSSLMAGEYKIVGNEVVFTIYESYIEGRENVKGTFTLSCQLNENAVGSASQKEIAFDGVTVPVKFDDVEVKTSKKVNWVEGDAGTVKTTDPNNYTIPYEIIVKPNASLDSLVLIDTLSAGQEIVGGKVTIEVQASGGWQWIDVTVSGNPFEIDLAAILERKGLVVEANATYKITYNTQLTEDYVYGNELTNTADWSWTGNGSATNETTIKVIKEVDISKKNVAYDESAGIYTYTLTIGDGETDLRGYTITDTMSANQVLDGAISILPSVGGESSIPANEAPENASGEFVLFEYTFPEDAATALTGPYTITYTTKPSEDESLTGWQSISNKLDTKDPEGNPTEDTDATYKDYDFGGATDVSIDKEFSKIDKEEKLIWWEVTITVPEGETLQNALIQERDFKYNKNYKDYEMEIDWEKVSIINKTTGQTLSAGNDYIIDKVYNNITIPSLSGTIVVSVPVKCPDAAFENDVYFQNTAAIGSNGNEIKSDHAEYTYKEEYELKKYVNKGYDASTGLVEWKIDVNPNYYEYSDDLTVYLTDVIPDGMEYYSDATHKAYLYDSSSWSTKEVEFDWTSANTWRLQLGKLNKTTYSLTYWTKVTSEEVTEQYFTNHASLYKTGESTPLADAQVTATVKREILDKWHTQNKDIITYTIDVNKEAMDLSYDDTLILMDKIPEEVELVINNQKGSVIFTDAISGAQITSGVSFSYQDRNLVLTIPDNKYIKITYEVRVNELSTGVQTISNTVNLSGKVNVSETDKGDFVVSSHSSTITGNNAGKLVINKLDAGDLAKKLPGAKFDVYTVSLSADGNSVEEAKVDEITSDENGVAKTAEKLTVNRLYYWVETQAPSTAEAEYVLDTTKHYFIVYDKTVKRAQAEETVAAIQAADASYAGISVVYAEETVNTTVTNMQKTTGAGQIKIQKSFNNGEALTAAEKDNITFVITSADGKIVKRVKYSEMTNGTYTFTDLPLGTYKVSELYADKDGYTLTTTYKVNGGDGTSVTLTDASAKTVAITNTYEGARLVVKKTIDGITGELPDELKAGIKFTVTGPNGFKEEFTYADMTNAEMVFENVPFGSYLVSESCDGKNQYKVKSSYTVESSGVYGANGSASVTLSPNHAEETVAWKNTYTRGKLTLLKTFDGTKVPTSVEAQNIIFTIVGKSGDWDGAAIVYEKTVTYDEMTGGSITLTDVPFGYYTVTESNADIPGYTLTETTYYVNGYESGADAASGTLNSWDSSLSMNFEVKNTYEAGPEPTVTEVTVKKVWEDADNQDGLRPGSIQAVLKQNGMEMSGEEYTVTLNEENNWTHTWSGLAIKDDNDSDYTYTVEEVAVPEGYTAAYDTVGNITTITNSHTPDVVSVGVTKVWEDAENQDGLRPASIEVQLYANGTAVDGKTLVLNTGNSWTGSFTDLPKYQDEGTEIDYTVKEILTDEVAAAYTTKVTGSAENGYTITNTHTPETVSVAVEKKWEDENNQDGKRPGSITVNLLKQIGNEAASIAQTKQIYPDMNGYWNYTFTNLPKYENGQEVIYSVEEVSVDGYTSVVTGTAADGYVITNTREAEKVTVAGTKIWDDNGNASKKRPTSITVYLLADGAIAETKVVTADTNGDWNYDFGELPKYKNGVEIVYAIAEKPVEGYTTTITGDEISGYTITNTENPTTSRTVKKVWDDNNNQDGKRPANITVVLKADGVATSGAEYTVTLDENNNWEYTWNNLPEKDGERLIVYTVEETVPAGYTPSYTTDTNADVTTITIKNTYTPEKASVSVEKIWDDANNQDGKRPASITVNLKKKVGENGAETTILSQKLTADANGDWNCTFTDLPKYENGTEIIYTVEEMTGELPSGYTSSVTGDAATGYVITNSYTPEVVQISGTKTWKDSDNAAGARPDSITVNLMADGVMLTEKSQTVRDDGAGNWTYTFDNLPKYKDGQEIVYTITENAVPEYSTKINGYDITNTYTPGTTSRSVQKVWDDKNDCDGIRPDSIQVELKAVTATGEAITNASYTATLSEVNNWKYTWSNLPRTKDGSMIYYSVAEISAPEGYTSSKVTAGTTTTITNTHTPETTELKVTKVWDDNENQDGIRPDGIGIKLMAGDKEMTSYYLTTADMNAGGNWEYTFTNLPKKENGRDIVYTVKEVMPATLTGADSYTCVITGNMASGYTITNKHTQILTQISGAKNWDDNNNSARKRPTSITVNLLADGEQVKSQTVKANSSGEWKYTFDKLPKFKDGKVIDYTITESPVANYSTVITGYDITNTYTPGITSRTVEKVWDDGNSTARPSSVRVQLYANDKVVGSPVTLSDANSWKHAWENLLEEQDGQKINYEVKELAVPDGYRAVYTVSGTNTVIKNTNKPVSTPRPSDDDDEPDPTPDNDDDDDDDDVTPTPVTKVTPKPSITPAPSASITPAPTESASPDRTPGRNVPGDNEPDSTPRRGGKTTPTPDGDDRPGEVLGASRVKMTASESFVLGARRGIDCAVLGKRRRPGTGDDFDLLIWILAMSLAAGSMITSSIMLTSEDGRRRR